MSRKRMFLFQIFYNQQTRQQLDPGFLPLDNSNNARQDWCEYWPIRQTLLNQQFADDDYIGFFSPRFSEKTSCTSEDVKEFVTATDRDLYSFSPYFDQSALYINSFEQGEVNHPGLIECTESLLQHLGVDLNIRQLVCDHTTLLYSNYFVTRYAIWKEWLALTEEVFHICESGDSPLAQRLTAETMHRGVASTQLKVFIIERLITVLLEKRGFTTAWGVDAMRAAIMLPQNRNIMSELIISDALKGQFRRSGKRMYIDRFMAIRKMLAQARASESSI